jgi:integrase
MSLPVPATGSKITYFTGAMVQGRPVPGGLGVRVTANGTRAYVLNYRIGGRERRMTIGDAQDGSWSVLDAVKRARELRHQIDRGDDPLAGKMPAKAKMVEETVTVGAVLDKFLERSPMRRPEIFQSAFDRLVKPAIGSMPIHDLKRRHIAEMLDGIEDNNGKVMAANALAYTRAALNWHAARDDDFRSPIVRGMGPGRPSARDRILTDEELRVLWPVFGETGNFGLAYRIMLLTGCRRGEVVGMTWEELSEDLATWIIPAERYKTKITHVVPLPEMAREIIADQTRWCSRVFPGLGGAQLSRGGNHKATVDKRAPGLARWRIHDLRRTARSLLGRAGVRPDIAARCLGHIPADVDSRVYDHHAYLDEKADAFERLAGLVSRILADDEAKVVRLRG